MTLWCRSPKGYSELRNSNFIMLPSEKILQKYKNHVKQDAVINKDMLPWMLNEAKLKNIPPEGYEDFSTINHITCAFPNIYSLNSKICFIMDISHTIKKRNNIAKIGDSSHCKRHLKLGLHFIEWKHFQSAYLWNIATHPFLVHHKLTQEHFFLTSESKMRIHFAENVLNDKMLHLMGLYQKSLGDDAFKKASFLVSNFRDARPITSASDDRLRENHDVMDFFVEWEREIKKDSKIKNNGKHLISLQTRQDIISSILGFEELCKQKFKHSNFSMVPNRINSDVIENIFCQQRTLYSGANTNPTYLSYCHSMNSVTLGQTTISRKSNTGGETAEIHKKNNQVFKKGKSDSDSLRHVSMEKVCLQHDRSSFISLTEKDFLSVDTALPTATPNWPGSYTVKVVGTIFTFKVRRYALDLIFRFCLLYNVLLLS
ncbi:hypothetical protein KUTeg_001387 [Tegillarca granosa]|uniref:Uncharacterized protein n=1 Tax=Tegillarca granosa TaxID=220873 RepID=A0ABQ9FVN7_TEGGR|nr:hypothetical protein KUTeg_001387 [Tegillarca granosa]